MLIDTSFEINATPLATAVLQNAGTLALEQGDPEVRSGHVLDALLSTTRIEGAIGELDLSEYEDATDFLRGEWEALQVPERDVASSHAGSPEYSGTVPYGPLVKQGLRLANIAASPGEIDVEHILIGMVLESTSVAARFLLKHGVTYDAIQQELDRQNAGRPELAVV